MNSQWKEERIIQLQDQIYGIALDNETDWASQIQELWDSSKPNRDKLEYLKSIANRPELGTANTRQNLPGIVNELIAWWELEWNLEQKEQELATERTTTQQALITSQEWHERQKAEITEAKDLEINQLKQNHQNYLNQRKSIIQQEITLLREILRN